jgi:hypothetical protein
MPIRRDRIIIIPLTSCGVLMIGCVSPLLNHHEQGNIHIDQEQWDEAIGEYNKAIELKPNLAMD